MKKTVEILRKMQYKRLRTITFTTLSVGVQTALFSFSPRDLSLVASGSAPDARIVSIEEMHDAIQERCTRHLLQRNDAILLQHCYPSPERFLQQGDISEAVASGEIKSTGKSVSVDDVLDRIDKALEANDEKDC